MGPAARSVATLARKAWPDPPGVAATLARGEIEEENYSGLDDADILRLVSVTELAADAGFTAAFPGKQGAEVYLTSPEEFASVLKADIAKWAKVVRDSGATVD